MRVCVRVLCVYDYVCGTHVCSRLRIGVTTTLSPHCCRSMPSLVTQSFFVTFLFTQCFFVTLCGRYKLNPNTVDNDGDSALHDAGDDDDDDDDDDDVMCVL